MLHNSFKKFVIWDKLFAASRLVIVVTTGQLLKKIAKKSRFTGTYIPVSKCLLHDCTPSKMYAHFSQPNIFATIDVRPNPSASEKVNRLAYHARCNNPTNETECLSQSKNYKIHDKNTGHIASNEARGHLFRLKKDWKPCKMMIQIENYSHCFWSFTQPVIPKYEYALHN